MRITVYYGTHKNDEWWEHEPDLHCPNCGEKQVYVEQGGGDYYVGNEHLCRSCGRSFYLPGGLMDATRDKYEIQRLEQLRSE